MKFFCFFIILFFPLHNSFYYSIQAMHCCKMHGNVLKPIQTFMTPVNVHQHMLLLPKKEPCLMLPLLETKTSIVFSKKRKTVWVTTSSNHEICYQKTPNESCFMNPCDYLKNPQMFPVAPVMNTTPAVENIVPNITAIPVVQEMQDVTEKKEEVDVFIPPPPPLINRVSLSVKDVHKIIDIPVSFKPPPPPLEKSVEKKKERLFKKIPDPILKDIVIDPQQLADICFFPLLYFYQIFCTFVFLDTEATGLGKGHKLTEIGCVKVENFQYTGEFFQAYINPERSVSPSAYQLTGYTQNFLSQYPVFKKVSPYFQRFIKNSVLVMHAIHYDLWLLNNALKECQTSTEDYVKLEKKYVVLDTFKIAQKLYPHDKKSLTTLCSLNHIDITKREKHGALIDAKLLAKLFLSMMRQTQYVFPEATNWNLMPKINFFDHFKPLEGSSGGTYFKKLGITYSLPSVFRYGVSIYHNQLHMPYPAIFVAFQDIKGQICGILAQYLLDAVLQDKNRQQQNIKSKYFYGSAQNALVSIHSERAKTVFIGKIINALVVKNILLDNEEYIRGILNLHEGFAIKACLDFLYLPSIEFDSSVREIILLLDHNGKSNTLYKTVLTNYIERFCNQQFFSFFGIVDQEKNIKDFSAKYDGYDWTVNEDYIVHGKRYIQLIRLNTHALTIVCDLTNREVSINNMIVHDPNTSILFSTPKITLKAVVLKTEKEKHLHLSDVLKNHPEKLVQRICSALQLNNIKDIEFLEKQEIALRKYQESLRIMPDSLAIDYLKKRGITCALPDTYRWNPKDYHYIFNAYFPALIVPLFCPKNFMIGIHRIFFKTDGSCLPKFITVNGKKKKLSTKLSIGKTVNAASEVYRFNIHSGNNPSDNSDAGVILVSEGMENALVIKQVMEKYCQNNDFHATRLFYALNIDHIFSIKACVGINGLIDVPLEKNTHTVVILADNDGKNIDAKQTMRKTVEYFLHKKLNVKIVLPTTDHQEKIDINDLFLQKGKDGYQNIYHLLQNAIEIHQANDLGQDTEPLQQSLEKIRIQYESEWEYSMNNTENS